MDLLRAIHIFLRKDSNRYVYQDRLYLGMEADNSLGARLWRTKVGIAYPGDQADWEEVAADANGLPFGDFKPGSK